MSLLLDEYEQRFRDLSAILFEKVPALSNISGEAKQKLFAELNSAFEDADCVVRKMELETFSTRVETSLKAPLLVQVKRYKSVINHLKKQATDAISRKEPTGSKDGLLETGIMSIEIASAAAPSSLPPMDQRQESRVSTDASNEVVVDEIKERKAVIVDIGESGAGIVQDLHHQNQSRLQATLYAARCNLRKNKDALWKMASRMGPRNLILVGLVNTVFVCGIYTCI